MSTNRNAADQHREQQTPADDKHDHASPSESEQGNAHRSHRTLKTYLRFAAMILTSMVVMYWVMFAGSWEWSHIRFSQSRIFMSVTMGGTMGLVMLAWMLGMYKSVKGNTAVIAASVLLIGGGIALDRSQVTVNDTAFMHAMIPHHSLAITRAERFQNVDVRVCELAAEISEAQRREIDEMDWLIDDIEENGVVATVEEAESRAVPEFPASADRVCPSE
ncbi:DUF305 domain-containing protein [Agromyces bauzanensis]|uniref:DUF305 domain-containing protein n=1 Tax=Agromyces bauzanensis TaxID=1308924 RepID=A0A917PNM3_9MICO|nr:DUF305 domain-containing protein [Agromyces bauzanensis]GGJ85065.1 hypothetical protein GCM10011372_24230 [Agromyces bauzanensis]